MDSSPNIPISVPVAEPENSSENISVIRDLKLKYVNFDLESTIIVVVYLFAQLLFPNGLFLFLCSFTLIIILLLVQRPLKSGVFTVIAVNHVLQIIAAVWEANSVGRDINFRSPYMGTAIIASCIGLFIMFIPILYYQSRLPTLSWNSLKKEAEKLSTSKTFNCYLISFFATNFLSAIAFALGGFTQIIFSLVKIKWLFFLLFGYQVFLKNEKKNLFYAFALLEFIAGFYSFFSQFKIVIYFSIVLFLGLLETVNLKKIVFAAIIGISLGVFGLLWTTVKGTYRSFLNEGSKEQVAAVSRDEALLKLYDLSSNVSEKELNSSSYQFLDRLQYVFHFARTMERVPSVIPYQNGQNWKSNIEYVITPRLLNPNKPIFDATEKTKRFTGIPYLGRKAGVSFSLGYFAECYIDFGLWGMMFPLFLIGLMYGLTYWYIMRKASRNFLFNFPAAGAFFLEFFAYEMDGTILLGRFLATLITFYLLIQFVFPWVMRYISIPPTNQPQIN